MCSTGKYVALLVANRDSKVSEHSGGELSEYLVELKKTSKQVELLKRD